MSDDPRDGADLTSVSIKDALSKSCEQPRGDELKFRGDDGLITTLYPAEDPGAYYGSRGTGDRNTSIPGVYRAVYVNSETGHALSCPIKNA